MAIVLSVIFNLSYLVGPPSEHLSKIKYFLLPVLGVFALRSFFAQTQIPHLKKVLWILFVTSATLASINGLIGWGSGFSPLKWGPACHESRTCGAFGMYMTYAHIMLFFLVLFLGVILLRFEKARLKERILLISIFALNFIGFYLSQSRGALIALLVSLPFFFIRKTKIFWTSLIVIGVLSVSAFFFVPTLKELFTDRTRLSSVTTRTELWQAAWATFKESPIIGIGHRNFEPHSLEIERKLGLHEFQGTAHSNIFETLATTGLLGAIGFILFHLAWLFELYRRKDVIGLMGVPFVISLSVCGLTEYVWGNGTLLFLIMGFYMISQTDFAKNINPLDNK